jgi:predicted nucleic-acid-binding protein
MKGLDTNVLIHLIVADDPDQAAAAERYIRRECAPDTPCLINRVVLCELVWVLERAYGYARSDIARAMEALLRTAQFRCEDADAAWAALRAYRTGAGDFADAVIGRSNRRQGCEATGTFDRKAARLDGFEAI